MGWSVGYDNHWSRDIGYGVPAICDHPDCDKKIDRGLSYVCGGEPYGGDSGCGLYFCDKHHSPLCARCQNRKRGPRQVPPFDAKPDTEEWTNHKMTDPSWEKWREENGK